MAIINWNGSDLPDALRPLPAGRYIVEALDESPPLTADEEDGLIQALDSLRAEAEPVLDWFADGKRMLVRNSNGRLQVVQASDGRSLAEGPKASTPLLARDAPWVAYSDERGLAIYDFAAQREILRDPRALRPVAWHDLRLLAKGSAAATVLAPGAPPVELGDRAAPHWSRDGRRIGFYAEQACDAATGKVVSYDGFVADGPDYQADGAVLTGPNYSLVQVPLPPVALEFPWAAKLADDMTLLAGGSASGGTWGGRIDLLTGTIDESEQGRALSELVPDRPLSLRCNAGSWTAREPFTDVVAATVHRPCAEDALTPIAPPLYLYAPRARCARASAAGDCASHTELLDAGTGRTLARFDSAIGLHATSLGHFVGTARGRVCQAFDVARRSLLETPPIPGAAELSRCEYWGDGIFTAEHGRDLYVWEQGQGFLRSAAPTSSTPVAFCRGLREMRSAFGCVTPDATGQTLDLYRPDRGSRQLHLAENRPLSDIVAAPDLTRIALRAGRQSFVVELDHGVLSPWGPLDFIPTHFSADSCTLLGNLWRIDDAGRLLRVVREARFRDGREEQTTPEARLPPGFGTLSEYQPSPSGRIGVRVAMPLTLVRYDDLRVLRVLVAPLDGHVRVLLVDQAGNYLGDPALAAQLHYATGTSVRDAQLLTGTEATSHFDHPELILQFIQRCRYGPVEHQCSAGQRRSASSSSRCPSSMSSHSLPPRESSNVIGAPPRTFARGSCRRRSGTCRRVLASTQAVVERGRNHTWTTGFTVPIERVA
ncbi:MAG: hypothetical protein ABIQ16_19130 [Polyangiaceae bacterium]